MFDEAFGNFEYDDSSNNGAWIPTIAVDQIGAMLARWLGVASADLGYLFPNLSRSLRATSAS